MTDDHTAPVPTSDELRELLGAYALDALDALEREQVDALLLTDASARAELHELQHAAAWLGHASLRPPTSAWDAIAGEVARDLQTEAATPETLTPESESESVTVLPTRSAPRRGARWLVAAAAAMVLVVGTAGVVAIADRQSGPEPVTAQYEAALENPSARQVTLSSTDGAYSARAVVLDDGTGYLADASLPELESDRDFQLWSITPDGPVSVGLIRGGAVKKFTAADATSELAVTNEPRGGSRAPTGNPIVSGELEAQ